MAACGEIPDPGRPPETLAAHLRKCDAEGGVDANFNLERCVYESRAKTSARRCHASGEAHPRSPKLDLKSNCRQSLRKVFFKRSSHTAPTNASNNNNNSSSHNVDANLNSKKTDPAVVPHRALITTVSQTVADEAARARKRYSLHQDVEEALNSLLWQPYEYQRSNRTATHSYSSNTASNSSSTSDYCYDHRTSLCSSSCSSLSSSSGLESSNNGKNRSGNTADLHLLVNNLRPQCGVDAAQRRSRDLVAEADLRNASRAARLAHLPLAAPVHAQRSNVLEACSVVPHVVSRRPTTTHTQHHSSSSGNRNNNTDVLLALGSQCDVLRSPTGDTMRVEIQPPSIKSVITSSGSTGSGANNAGGAQLLLRTGGAGGGGGGGQMQEAAAASASLPPPPRNTRTTARNLSSVNVVGLPYNHARQNSVPASLTIAPTSSSSSSAPRSLVPNHARNISEPYRGVHSFISNASVNAARTNSSGNINNINCSAPNVVSLFNHQRLSGGSAGAHLIRTGHPQHTGHPIAFTSSTTVGSANASAEMLAGSSGNNDISGVPGAASVVGVGVVRTSSSNNNSRAPLNVSNVNVNYYRAVPVNVVSAVPTIQCLNTSGGGGGGGSSSMAAATSCTSAAAVTTASIGTATDCNNVSNVNIVQAMPLSTSNSGSHLNPIVMPPMGGGGAGTATCAEVVVHTAALPPPPPPPQQPPAVEVVRTFTSTEAQTDDAIIPPPEGSNASREQRRRERRERRHQRRLNIANHRHAGATTSSSTTVTAAGSHTATGGGGGGGTDPPAAHHPSAKPDLLNTTLPPPYNGAHHPHHAHQHHPTPHQHSVHQLTHPHPPPAQPPPVLQPTNIMVPPGTIVQSLVPNSLVPNGLVPNAMVPFHPQVVPGQVPLVQAAPGAISVPVPSPTGFRFPLPANGFRRTRFSEDPPKSCCGLLAWRPGSLRWFIALIALVAVCCVLVGTALGAMGPSGRDHLTVSLLMIGVGIILVTVSGVAWRLTSHDSSTCRSMLGLGSTESVEACPRRFVPRLPPSYGRPHHPYAAMMYPEFQYRPPPPSYQASMQEYRLRLLLLDRGNTPQIQAGIQNAVSPPPTYRSHSGSLLRVPLSNRRDASQSEYSCPPSYRSQNSSSRAAAMLQNNSIMHSREQSLSLSESNQDSSVVNVVNILSANEEDIALDNITLDSLKLEPEEINPLKMLLKGSSGDLEGTKDGNLVTIVQTNDQSPVIVTVSGSSHSDNRNTVTEISNEMEILAHL